MCIYFIHNDSLCMDKKHTLHKNHTSSLSNPHGGKYFVQPKEASSPCPHEPRPPASAFWRAPKNTFSYTNTLRAHPAKPSAIIPIVGAESEVIVQQTQLYSLGRFFKRWAIVATYLVRGLHPATSISSRRITITAHLAIYYNMVRDDKIKLVGP